jgi:hypothetical protein
MPCQAQIFGEKGGRSFLEYQVKDFDLSNLSKTASETREKIPQTRQTGLFGIQIWQGVEF